MAEKKIELIAFICDKCGYEWMPKVIPEYVQIKIKPKTCPRCKSYKWNDSVKSKSE